MDLTRRNVLKMGAALAAIPLAGDLASGAAGEKRLRTGSPELDSALGGGIPMGRVLVVIGPRGSGKSAFMRRLAEANGITDLHLVRGGTSDMLSIMEREDGRYIGALMLDAPEPATPTERTAMEASPAARHAFLTRWFTRSRDVVHESGGGGGVMALSACADPDATAEWMQIPDYIITVSASSSPRLLRQP